jgi:hypothetical protein
MRVPACKEPTDPFWTRAGPPKGLGLLHPKVILRSLKRCPAMPPSENVYVDSRDEVRNILPPARRRRKAWPVSSNATRTAFPFGADGAATARPSKYLKVCYPYEPALNAKTTLGLERRLVRWSVAESHGDSALGVQLSRSREIHVVQTA